VATAGKKWHKVLFYRDNGFDFFFRRLLDQRIIDHDWKEENECQIEKKCSTWMQEMLIYYLNKCEFFMD
jgi:hypothetical protein